MNASLNRRRFLRHLGVSAAALPFLAGLPSLMGATLPQRRQRLIILFSPNGTVPNEFWPDQQGENFEFKSILKPLEAFKSQTLVLNGICNKVRGDGDNHMRGMSCLLTGSELLPGNIMGGGGTPAGWASSISIDQEIRNFLQGTAGDADAIWLRGVWGGGAGPGRSLDAHELHGGQSAGRADR